jgi:hypothetical protein
MLEGESAKISSSSLEKQYTSKQEIEDIIQEFFNQEKYQDYVAFVQGILISQIPAKGLFLGGASGKRNITTFFINVLIIHLGYFLQVFHPYL